MDIEKLKDYLKSFSMVGALNSIEELQRENQLLRHEQLQLAAIHTEDIVLLQNTIESLQDEAGLMQIKERMLMAKVEALQEAVESLKGDLENIRLREMYADDQEVLI